jgi:hypothetical protein
MMMMMIIIIIITLSCTFELCHIFYVLMTDSTTLTFNGSQHMLITMPDEFHTQAEDVALRFRTTRPLGLLLITNTEQSADRLELALMGGRVRLVARLGDREKVGPHTGCFVFMVPCAVLQYTGCPG